METLGLPFIQRIRMIEVKYALRRLNMGKPCDLMKSLLKFGSAWVTWV